MIVIACNTASLQRRVIYETQRNPHSGVITPGAQAVAEVSSTKRIGVIGTVGTINSQAYDKAIKGISPENIELVSVACPAS